MPKSLEKTRKQISKKRNGEMSALHENSRNAQRLRRAANRDDKLVKVASARKKQDRAWIERVEYFQKAVRSNDVKALSPDEIKTFILGWVNQHDEEADTLKKARRPGRPASTREDLLRMKIDADKKEYEKGFYMPDISDQENVEMLDRWDGNWSYLSNMKWVRITPEGEVSKSKFPPKSEA